MGGLGGVVGAACGTNHSLVVSGVGVVYGWGKNDCAQLAVPENIADMKQTK